MTEIKQNKRVPEIELMKAVAIIDMVLVHTLEGSWDSLNNADTGIAYLVFYLIEFIGGIFGGGGFMFAMGWGAAYSDKATAKSYLKRFIQLVLLGLFVNIFEEFVPGIIDPKNYGPVSDFPYAILAVDIYFYAALFMLVFALFKLLKDNEKVKMIISIGMVTVFFIVNTLVPARSFTTGNDWADTLMGLFIRENDYSYFPMVTWGIYTLAGYWLAKGYRKMNNRRNYAIMLFIVGLPILVLSEIMVTVNNLPHEVLNPGGYDEEFYYAMHSWSMLGGFGLLCLELLLYMGIMQLSKQRIHKFFLFLSKNVMFLYVAQWVVLGFLYPSLGKIENIWINNLVAIAILITICLACLLKDRIKERIKS